MRIKAVFLLFIVISIFAYTEIACTEKIKEPSVAGTFYPAEGNALKGTVDEFLQNAESKPVEGRLLVLISPHAGHAFSGGIAAYGYKQLRDRDIRTVILVGASHNYNYSGASVYTKGSFKTPLGNIKIDEKLALSLINKDANVDFYPAVFEKEHTIEVQLPFLQRVLKDFRIVPILIGNPSNTAFDHLRKTLAKIMAADTRTVLIASTDLSHYHDYETAVQKDKKLIDAIERLSTGDAEVLLMKSESEMCGSYPVILSMYVAKDLGANQGIVFKSANSGDVTGDKDRVVGYASMGLFRSPLTKEEKEELLFLAKRAIVEYVTKGKTLDVEIKNQKLKADASLFVTINRGGRLRGCIGNVGPPMPLYKAVIRNAIAASSKDFRFMPMKKEEIEGMEVEISILTPFEEVKDVRKIEVGRDGLYIVKDGTAGLLLPQVPLEFGWDRETFLKEVSIKAGLPEDAWKEGAELYRFGAEIIREAASPGEAVPPPAINEAVPPAPKGSITPP